MNYDTRLIHVNISPEKSQSTSDDNRANFVWEKRSSVNGMIISALERQSG